MSHDRELHAAELTMLDEENLVQAEHVESFSLVKKDSNMRTQHQSRSTLNPRSTGEYAFSDDFGLLDDIYINSLEQRWVCHICTFLNHPELIQCELCETFCIDGVQSEGTEILEISASSQETISPKSRGRTSSFGSDMYSRFSRVSKTIKSIKQLGQSPKEEPEDLLFVAMSKLQRLQSGATSRLHSATQAILARNRRSSSDYVASAQTIMVLDSLQLDLNHRCVRGDEVFEPLLRRLWSTIYENSHNCRAKSPSQAFERISERWIDVGFQRADPETDFRGGGILALKCLVYAFEAYPKNMLRIAMQQQPGRSKKWYPVCAAGINLTCIIASLLHIGNSEYEHSSEVYWKLFEEPEGFYELFYYAFLIMDAAWHHLNGSYMEFGVVLKATRRMIQHILNQEPQNIQELRILAEQTNVDRFVVPIVHRPKAIESHCSSPYSGFPKNSRVSLTSPNVTRAATLASC